MKDLSQNAVSWVVLVTGGAAYIAMLVMSSNKAVAPLLVTGAIVMILVFRNELSPKRRRRRRLDAGLCPVCAYDLQYDFGGGCSECGWARHTGDSLSP